MNVRTAAPSLDIALSSLLIRSGRQRYARPVKDAKIPAQ